MLIEFAAISVSPAIIYPPMADYGGVLNLKFQSGAELQSNTLF
jgi:hypothetical protein